MPTGRSAGEFLEELDGPLTLGGALAALRESSEESLATFATRLRVSRQHLCDIEQGRKVAQQSSSLLPVPPFRLTAA
jgi:DNA-binding transcriptional regulator YiaG